MLDQGRETFVVRCLRGSLLAAMRMLFRIEHHGLEHVPADGPLIIAPNHVTYFDPFWVGVGVYRKLRFMAWDKIFAIPPAGAIFRWLGAFPVSLENPESSAYRASLAVLRAGEALMIFPEGGRSPDGALQPLKDGAARLAVKTGTPILPVAVLGGHAVWGPQLWVPRPRKVVIEFLPPLPVPVVDARKRRAFDEATRALNDQLAEVLRRRLAPQP